jgi:iron(III) transport system ATP-binding protein
MRGRRIEAVADSSFEVADGEMLVLLGPSGCGKTTTLRCLSGMDEPTAGTISFGDHVVYDRAQHVSVPTHRRDLGMVFQSFALWPHMSARANIAYPLRSKRVPRSERNVKVEDFARLVDLDVSLLDKRPGQLSGGQQQRVALARAMVAQPSVLLFDEPLSSLDARLREQLRVELRAVHRRVGFTGVYVTHDLQEALALGDKVAVMQSGRIQQFGTPEAVFDKPVNRVVAELLGFRRLATLGRDEAVVKGDLPRWRRESGALDLLARPSLCVPRRPSDPVAAGTVRVGGWTVADIEPTGDYPQLVLQRNQQAVRLPLAGQTVEYGRSDDVDIEVPGKWTRYFDGDGVALPVPEALAALGPVESR